MNPTIDIIGIGADGPAGLRAELVERIRAAEFLAGGQRHLDHFPQSAAERFVIKDNLVALLEELSRRHARQRCVVLASGDPLFYGVGTYVIRVLGGQNVRIEPGVSSMQLAFARARLSWQDAALASIHGRDLRTTVLPLLGRAKIGLFTQDGRCPGRVAELFARCDLADQYEAFVGENLGTADERVSDWPNLHQLVNQHFGSLNYLILRRTRYAGGEVERYRALVPGVPDKAFARADDDTMMTRQEVRAVLLGKMAGALQAGSTVWDIGAGIGTVSVEIAVLRRDVEVIAVEVDPARSGFLRTNRERFDAWNIRLIDGTAPQALVGLTDSPRLVFVGGSGGHLSPILDQVESRLQVGGRLLANFVTLENLATTWERFRARGWRCEVTEIQVARSDVLGGQTGLKPQRGVFIFSADKPGGES
jgi:precorrin-6Y C5,15-methyltransferase (decarboxylating)